MHDLHIRSRVCPLLAAIELLFVAQSTSATELVYAPTNAAFGGNSMATQMLLSTAQATNKHTAPVNPSSPLTKQTALQQFNDMLERAVLGQLASATTSGIIGPNGKLTPGTVETGNFKVTITDLGGGLLQISTTDKTTGDTTTFQIGGGGL